MLDSLHSGLRRAGFPAGGTIAIALSGGPDSTALALALHESIGRGSDMAVVAAHYNHKTRGDESDADERFVRELCAKLGIQLRVEHSEKPRRWLSEADARLQRYEFLQRAAEGLGAKYVAVAHTQDDQAETVLLRITRGTGIRGLAAMPYARPISRGSNVQLIRPMLEVSRWQVNMYLREHEVEARHDVSNDNVRYARNRIRHRVLPELTEINNQAVDAITRLADLAREHIDYINEQAEVALNKIDVNNLDGILDLPKPVAAQVIFALHGQIAEAGNQLEQWHIESVLWFLDRGLPGATVLPGEVVLRRRSGSTVMEPEFPYGVELAAPIVATELPVPGRVELSDGTSMKAEIVDAPKSFEGAPRRGHDSVLVARSIADNRHLAIRSPKPGDRYMPLGMREEKKLRHVMSHAKMPRQLRDGVPIVISPIDGRIVWVAGFPPANWARLQPGDKRCVRLVVYGRNDARWAREQE